MDHGVSRTAVVVCQGRAVAHERIAPGRFSDPTAMSLLRDDERAVVGRVRADAPPDGWRDRMEFELVRACGEVMAARTVAIDDALRAGPGGQVVILGAGLDGRAWRIAGLANAAVFEVDRPMSQRDKRERAAGLKPAAAVHFVPVDFGRDDLRSALTAAGCQDQTPTTWVWEGVVPYLTRRQVARTLAALSDLSAPASRIVVNYQAPAIVATAGRLALAAFTAIARRPSPLRGEPRRSSWTPESMARLLARHGFSVVRDDDLLAVADELSMAARQPRQLKNGRVVVAVRS